MRIGWKIFLAALPAVLFTVSLAPRIAVSESNVAGLGWPARRQLDVVTDTSQLAKHRRMGTFLRDSWRSGSYRLETTRRPRLWLRPTVAPRSVPVINIPEQPPLTPAVYGKRPIIPYRTVDGRIIMRSPTQSISSEQLLDWIKVYGPFLSERTRQALLQRAEDLRTAVPLIPVRNRRLMLLENGEPELANEISTAGISPVEDNVLELTPGGEQNWQITGMSLPQQGGDSSNEAGDEGATVIAVPVTTTYKDSQQFDDVEGTRTGLQSILVEVALPAGPTVGGGVEFLSGVGNGKRDPPGGHSPQGKRQDSLLDLAELGSQEEGGFGAIQPEKSSSIEQADPAEMVSKGTANGEAQYSLVRLPRRRAGYSGGDARFSFVRPGSQTTGVTADLNDIADDSVAGSGEEDAHFSFVRVPNRRSVAPKSEIERSGDSGEARFSFVRPGRSGTVDTAERSGLTEAVGPSGGSSSSNGEAQFSFVRPVARWGRWYRRSLDGSFGDEASLAAVRPGGGSWVLEPVEVGSTGVASSNTRNSRLRGSAVVSGQYLEMIPVESSGLSTGSQLSAVSDSEPGFLVRLGERPAVDGERNNRREDLLWLQEQGFGTTENLNEQVVGGLSSKPIAPQYAAYYVRPAAASDQSPRGDKADEAAQATSSPEARPSPGSVPKELLYLFRPTGGASPTATPGRSGDGNSAAVSGRAV